MATSAEACPDLHMAYGLFFSTLGQPIRDDFFSQNTWNLYQFGAACQIAAKSRHDVFAAEAVEMIASKIGDQVPLVIRRAAEAPVLSNLAISASLAGQMGGEVADAAGAALVRLGMSPEVMRPALDPVEVVSRLQSYDGGEIFNTLMLVYSGREDLRAAFAEASRSAARRGVMARRLGGLVQASSIRAIEA